MPGHEIGRGAGFSLIGDSQEVFGFGEQPGGTGLPGDARDFVERSFDTCHARRQLFELTLDAFG